MQYDETALLQHTLAEYRQSLADTQAALALANARNAQLEAHITTLEGEPS